MRYPKTLYHLSTENHDREKFKPRIPWGMLGEDDTQKRVCFSSSISGAFRAITYNQRTYVMYVHVPVSIKKLVNANSIYRPTKDQVPDVHMTGEYWVTGQVTLKCIGSVMISKRYKPGNKELVKFKWLSHE